MDSESVDCVVVGAGVVGIAVARALAMAGREVLVVEAAEGIGTQTSARNSEVVHAGIYYPAGSLMARLCVEGRRQLYTYCAQRGVPVRPCGKLIVATSADDDARLPAILARAQANGVEGMQLLTSAQACAMEPALVCTSALLSPGSGLTTFPCCVPVPAPVWPRCAMPAVTRWCLFPTASAMRACNGTAPATRRRRTFRPNHTPFTVLAGNDPGP